MLSDIALCSRAMAKLGADPVQSFDDDTAESEIASQLYGSTRDAVLSAHPWTFALGQTLLSPLMAVPVADFRYAFDLPPDFLRVVSAGTGSIGRGLVYRIHERRLHCDAESVNLTYIFRPDESAWPPFFDQVLIARLAAEFALPITESSSRADALHKLAGSELALAKTIDGQQQTPGRIEDFSLIDVR